MSVHYEETAFGFEFGAATVERVCSGGTKGWVVLSLVTRKHKPGNGLQIYVTKTGKVRISDNRGEWMQPSGKDGAR